MEENEKLENAEDKEEATKGNDRNSLTSLRGYSHTFKLIMPLNYIRIITSFLRFDSSSSFHMTFIYNPAL